MFSSICRARTTWTPACLSGKHFSILLPQATFCLYKLMILFEDELLDPLIAHLASDL